MSYRALGVLTVALWGGITVALAVATVPGCAARAERVGVAAMSAPYALAAVAGDPSDGCPVPVGCFARQPNCRVSVCFCGRVCQALGQRFELGNGGRVWSRGGTDACRCV